MVLLFDWTRHQFDITSKLCYWQFTGISDKIQISVSTEHFWHKVGCFFLVVIVYILLHAEFGQNDHLGGVSHFNSDKIINYSCIWSIKYGLRQSTILLFGKWIFVLRNSLQQIWRKHDVITYESFELYRMIHMIWSI